MSHVKLYTCQPDINLIRTQWIQILCDLFFSDCNLKSLLAFYASLSTDTNTQLFYTVLQNNSSVLLEFSFSLFHSLVHLQKSCKHKRQIALYNRQTYKTIEHDQLTLCHEYLWHQARSKHDAFASQLLHRQVLLPVLYLHHRMLPLETCKVTCYDEGASHW